MYKADADNHLHMHSPLISLVQHLACFDHACFCKALSVQFLSVKPLTYRSKKYFNILENSFSLLHNVKRQHFDCFYDKFLSTTGSHPHNFIQ